MTKVNDSNPKKSNNKRVTIITAIAFLVLIIIYIIDPNAARSILGVENNNTINTSDFVIKNFEQGFPQLPKKENYENINHRYYGVAYSQKYKDPLWVSYILTKKMVKIKKVDRSEEEFTKDPNLSTNYALSSDYTGSGYDRGHMCPAGDMNFNQTAMTECFFMVNITPQKPGLNRKIWKDLEEKVRDWAVENDSLYVVAGAIYSQRPRRLGKDKVAIPSKFYKVIADISAKDGYKAIAFIFDNKDYSNNAEFMDYAFPVDSLENMTGIDFFYNYHSANVEKIEASLNKNLWK